jgi:hypothetical protein
MSCSLLTAHAQTTKISPQWGAAACTFPMEIGVLSLCKDHHYRAAPGLEPETVLGPKHLPPAPTSGTIVCVVLSGVIGLALIGVLIGVILCGTKLLGMVG